MNHHEFAERNGITLAAIFAGQKEEKHNAMGFTSMRYTYTIQLHKDGAHMTTEYHVGSGILEHWAKEVDFRPQVEGGRMNFHQYSTNRNSRTKAGVQYLEAAAKAYQPKPGDLLCCLQMDAQSFDDAGGDFGAWADEWAVDLKPSEAWRTFQNLSKSVGDLRRFLGARLYADLMECTED